MVKETVRPRRAWPVVFVLLAAPFIAELLWGTTTVSQAAGLLAQVGLYGCGALVIREVTVRWGGGWGPVLLLGVAYGAVEEGMLEPTWLTPRFFAHPYGAAGGVFWSYAVFNAGYHAVFSIGIPLALTWILFPAWRGRPLLHRPGLCVAGAIYLVNAAAIGIAWYTVLQKSAFGFPARVHSVQLAGVGAGVIVLIVAAWAVARRGRGAGAVGAAGGVARRAMPGAVAAGVIAGVAALLWFAILVLATSQNDLRWLPAAGPLAVIVIAVAAACRWAAGRAAPSPRQLLAACTGALVVQAAAGFAATGLHGPVDIIGKAVLNVAELAVLIVLLLRQPADMPAGQAAAEPLPAVQPDGVTALGAAHRAGQRSCLTQRRQLACLV